MLAQTLIFLINTIGDLFAFALITRFLLQWVRAPARNQLSEFVAALTNFIVIPARRFVPGLWGLDLATLMLALMTETLKLWLLLEINGARPGGRRSYGTAGVIRTGSDPHSATDGLSPHWHLDPASDIKLG